MSFIKLTDLNLKNKKIFIRSDLNVPMKNKQIISDKRIIASIPTIQFILNQGAKVFLTSHLGRPIEGEYDENFSLKPIVKFLEKKLNRSIRLIKNYLEEKVEILENELVVLENVRFNQGEKKNDENLSRKYASLCDIYVMDAFGTSHRAHASTYGIIKFAPISCAGFLLMSEIKSLKKVMKNPKRPMVAIVGGAKVSTKLTVLESLAKISDQIIVGGGIANTFIAAKGHEIGLSLYEDNLIKEAEKLLLTCDIPIPTDVKVAKEFSENAKAITKSVNNINQDEQILDLGDESIKNILKIIKKAKTIIWNGPIGVFEFPNFRKGTELVANEISKSNAFSIVGGGDTLAAVDFFNIKDKISHISTGGGAFLEFIEGKKLPVIEALKKNRNYNKNLN